MATDIGQKLDEAMVAILSADAGIQGLAERSDALVIPWGDFGKAKLPVILFKRVDLVDEGGLGDTRSASYDFTAVAETRGGQAMVNALAERCEKALTQPALAAQGLDATPRRRPWLRQTLGSRDQVTGTNTKQRVAEQLQAHFLVTK